jgi:hypothetical protein
MAPVAWAVCIAWVSAAAAVAIMLGRRGVREGRGPLLSRRLRTPTVYLFSGYLIVAALVTPLSPGESVSPLLGLGVAVPAAYALASCSAIGAARASPARALLLAALHGGAVFAVAAIILAIASPRFVPVWLR